MKLVTSTLVLVLQLAVAAPGHADMRNPGLERAQKLLLDGNRHYKVREFDRAIELYKEAALIEPVPVFWYNLGQAFRQQGKYKEAIWYYKRYLADAEPGDERPEVERFIAAMQQELDRRAETETPLSPGPERAPEGDRAARPSSIPPPPDLPASPSRALRYAGWATGGAGVVLVGIGLVVGAGASSKWSDAKAMCEGSASPLPCSAGGVTLHDEAARTARMSTITVASGLVAVAAGATMLLLAPSSSERRRTAAIRITPAIGPSGGGLAVSGGF